MQLEQQKSVKLPNGMRHKCIITFENIVMSQIFSNNLLIQFTKEVLMISLWFELITLGLNDLVAVVISLQL